MEIESSSAFFNSKSDCRAAILSPTPLHSPSTFNKNFELVQHS